MMMQWVVTQIITACTLNDNNNVSDLILFVCVMVNLTHSLTQFSFFRFQLTLAMLFVPKAMFLN